jgi:hypothetical protein
LVFCCSCTGDNTGKPKTQHESKSGKAPTPLKPKPPDTATGGKPGEQSPDGASKDEAAATSKLNFARTLLDNGKKDKAKEHLQALVKDYPKTNAADEARALLDDLE